MEASAWLDAEMGTSPATGHLKLQMWTSAGWRGGRPEPPPVRPHSSKLPGALGGDSDSIVTFSRSTSQRFRCLAPLAQLTATARKPARFCSSAAAQAPLERRRSPCFTGAELSWRRPLLLEAALSCPGLLL